MQPATFDFIDANAPRNNAAWRWTFTFKEAEAGPAINITGKTFLMQLRKRGPQEKKTAVIEDPNSTFASKEELTDTYGQSVLALTIGDGFTITDGPGGELTLSVPKAKMQNLAGDYYYDLIDTTSGIDDCWLEGRVFVKPGISK